MKRLNAILSRVLGIKESEINDKTSPSNVDSWDSFNGIMMVSELEKEFKVKFTIKEAASVKCVKDIKDSLKKHGVKLNE